jgi:hypothetical protein
MKIREHEWNKLNLTTMKYSIGFYDLMQCNYCHTKIKKRSLGDTSTKRKCVEREIEIRIPKTIKITFCEAVGGHFANLTEVSNEYKDYKNSEL